jgi:hypothetical protein
MFLLYHIEESFGYRQPTFIPFLLSRLCPSHSLRKGYSVGRMIKIIILLLPFNNKQKQAHYEPVSLTIYFTASPWTDAATSINSFFVKFFEAIM